MAKNQKSYTPEFKQQIVDLHCKAGKGVTELTVIDTDRLLCENS